MIFHNISLLFLLHYIFTVNFEPWRPYEISSKTI